MDREQSLFQWERVKRFNFSVWTVLIGVLIARTSYFMAWPFLIVFLYQDYGTSAIEVGSMLAASALIGSVAGLYSGYLSDKFGRKWLMSAGCIIAFFAYNGIALASEVWHFYILILFTGLMHPLIDGPAKAVLGDSLDDLKDRELALNTRYFLLNIGGAIGPLIGVTLALSDPQSLFMVTGFTHLAYCFWILFGIERKGKFKQPDRSQLPNFRQTLKVISKDRIFVLLMLANLMLMFVYAQLESSVPQVIVRSGIEESATLIAMLLFINTATIVLFQFPLLKLMEKLPLFTRTRIGMILIAIGQLAFILSPKDAAIGWAIASFIISLGEVVTFPTINVQIDRLAPAHLRGSYFGATALYTLGFAIGPLLGGMMIEWLGANWLFGFCFIVCLSMIWLYWYAEHAEDPVEREPVTQT
ncbi:MFS transporter [Vibrio coralliilyticus]|uniref:MFS transporter n=1 Tax=Vibrio coralliilyticus TaxID=190893 RepID=A0A837G7N4_9VIBR|nr:MFS transporter [Vibrio coralliilyticus]KJY72231.1 MFS transporter [Vibrio coralliilyticus]QOU31947.1 MFS transporter [Vibrio coralliilyticus]